MPFVVRSGSGSPGGELRVNPQATERFMAFMAFMSFTASLQSEPCP